DPNTVVLEPAGCAPQEAGARHALLVGQHLGVGDSARVVDADVQVLPAGAVHGTAPIPVDPMSDALYPDYLLDVEVHQFPGAIRVVAHAGGPSVGVRRPTQAKPTADRTVGRERHAQVVRDRRQGPGLLPQALVVPHPYAPYRRRRTVRP